MRYFVGCYDKPGGKGVGEIFFRPGLAGFDRIVWDHSAPAPSSLISDRAGKRLYATCEGTESFAAVWDLSKGMKYLGKAKASGVFACHLCMSPDERFLYVANYGSGSVDVFPVTDEGVGERIQTIQNSGKGIDPNRQEGPHSHCVKFTPDGKYLCLCDLGVDAVIVYRQDPESGLLTEASRCLLPPGLGVRHILFRGDRAFACHEMGNALSRLKYADGILTPIDTRPLLTDEWRGKSFVAAIRAAGNRMYVSHRGKNAVSVLDENGDGIGEIPTHGNWPRDIWPLPGGRLLCANEYSGTVTLVTEAGEKIDEISAPGASGLTAAKGQEE